MMATRDARSFMVMCPTVAYEQHTTPAAAVRPDVGGRRKTASEESYKNKEPRLRGRGSRNQNQSAFGSAAAYFFGAEESVLEALLLFLLLWLFFFLAVEVDLAGADADVSDEGVVSAANTGPAAKTANRLTTGTSFLNIDRLHCKGRD
jgi:hypothetical protein